MRDGFLMRWALIALLTATGSAVAQMPPEVQNLRFDDHLTLSWDTATGTDHYNIYRARIADLASGAPSCHGFEIVPTTFDSPADPGAGDAYAYLVTAESATTGKVAPVFPRPARRVRCSDPVRR